MWCDVHWWWWRWRLMTLFINRGDLRLQPTVVSGGQNGTEASSGKIPPLHDDDDHHQFWQWCPTNLYDFSAWTKAKPGGGDHVPHVPCCHLMIISGLKIIYSDFATWTLWVLGDNKVPSLSKSWLAFLEWRCFWKNLVPPRERGGQRDNSQHTLTDPPIWNPLNIHWDFFCPASPIFQLFPYFPFNSWVKTKG